ncbi:MAG: serine hydrolase [Candidatus Neomarinimicrobiota bacterium]
MIRLLPTLLLFGGCADQPDDGLERFVWETDTPASQGFDPALLDSAFVQAAAMGYVDGLLVVRNGKLVAEDYYNGYSQSATHNVMSVSKSILSALTGIALHERFLDSLDEKVLDYFPEYIYDGIDARKYAITIRHLMTMRMGIDIEQNNYLQALATTDWLKTALELPLLSAPGERFRYNTLETHLLSAILTKTSGLSTLDLAREYLTDPLGIDIDYWTRDPLGYYLGGCDIHLTPREMAVFGLLYLNQGQLNGRQIVPQEWVTASLTNTWSVDTPQWGVLENYNYGLLWWLGEINGYELYMALGHGGQTILIFPELQLVVVTTADYNVGWDNNQEQPILELVAKYVLPAIQITAVY